MGTVMGRIRNPNQNVWIRIDMFVPCSHCVHTRVDLGEPPTPGEPSTWAADSILIFLLRSPIPAVTIEVSPSLSASVRCWDPWGDDRPDCPQTHQFV